MSSEQESRQSTKSVHSMEPSLGICSSADFPGLAKPSTSVDRPEGPVITRVVAGTNIIPSVLVKPVRIQSQTGEIIFIAQIVIRPVLTATKTLWEAIEQARQMLAAEADKLDHYLTATKKTPVSTRYFVEMTYVQEDGGENSVYFFTVNPNKFGIKPPNPQATQDDKQFQNHTKKWATQEEVVRSQADKHLQAMYPHLATTKAKE